MQLNRRFFLTAAGSITGTGLLSGCLLNSGPFGSCPAPDEEDGLEYKQIVGISNWFDDDLEDEPRQPHPVLVTDEKRASEVVARIHAGEDEKTFVQETNFSSEFLLMIQMQVHGQHEFDFNGVERVDDSTVKAYTCLTSRDGDQPDYDNVLAMFVRAPHENTIPENVEIEYRDRT